MNDKSRVGPLLAKTLSRRGILRGLAGVPVIGATSGSMIDHVSEEALSERHRPRQSLSETVWGWLPAPPAEPATLLVVDTTGIPLQTQVALTILQGLLNSRMRPGGEAVYLQVPNDIYHGGGVYPEGDRLWPSIYAHQAGIASHNGDPNDVAALARQRGVTQYVTWDPTVPATINVATTLAWIHGTAAFSPTDASGSLARNMKPLFDLRTLQFHAEADAYRWALGQLGPLRPETLDLESVGDLPTDISEGQVQVALRDYAVFAHAFVWIADTYNVAFGGRQDQALEDAIIETVASRSTTMFGWSNDEVAHVVLASKHGINFAAGDSPGLPASNLTVHSAVRTRAQQRPRHRPPSLEQGSVYASVVFTDGDNMGTLTNFHEGRWQDERRGEIPVGWSMQSMAPAWTPGIARHYFDSSTSNDELTGAYPFGYPDLASFVEQPLWDHYVKSAHAALSAARLLVSSSQPLEAPVLSAKQAGLWDFLHGIDAPKGHVFGYQAPPGLYPIGEPLWIDGRPLLPTGGYVPTGAADGYGPGEATHAISGISGAEAVNPGRPQFVVVGLGNYARYGDALTVEQAQFDDPVHFVLPNQLVELMGQAWQHGLARTTLLGLPTSINLDPYFLPHGDDCSSLALFGENGAWTQARYVEDGGSWAYLFNVERCRSAAASITAIGAGAVLGSADGVRWRRVASVATPQGERAQVTVDLSDLLPADHLWLRFISCRQRRFAVTSLRLNYNDHRRCTAISRQRIPSGLRLHIPSGSNLIATQTPQVPPHVTARPGPAAGSYHLAFAVPPAGVTATGYGGSTPVSWSVSSIRYGHAYSFRLENIVGRGRIYLDVYNGLADLASQEIQLSQRPQTLSLQVILPTSVPPTNPPVQIQVRAREFPVELTLTPVVRRVT